MKLIIQTDRSRRVIRTESGLETKKMENMERKTFNYFMVSLGETTIRILALTMVLLMLIYVGGNNLYAQGNALNFNKNASNYAISTNSISLSAFTFEAWIKSTYSYEGAGIVAIQNGPQMRLVSDYLSLEWATGLSFTGNTTINDNKWHHVACTYSFSGAQTSVALYVDGIADGTYTSTDPAINITDKILLGTSKDLATTFNGNLDEVRLWNVARSPAQISSTMNVSLTGNQGGTLLANYPFNQGVAAGSNPAITTLTDNSGNGNNCSLSNFSLSGTTSNWIESYAMVQPIIQAPTSRTIDGFTANWVAPTVGTVTGYYLFVASDNAFQNILSSYNGIEAFGTNYNVTGLNTASTYYYRVQAYKSGVGAGVNSATASSRTLGVEITSTPAISITQNSAVCGGNITNDDGAAISTRGICWSTSPNPTIASNNLTAGSGLGAFTCTLPSLLPVTQYHFRAYATNSYGTVYGDDLTFTTACTAISTFPYEETFDAEDFPSCWEVQMIGAGVVDKWSISPTTNAGGAANELKLAYQTVNPGTIRMITPPIVTTGLTSLNLDFKHYFSNYGSGCFIKVQTSIDKTNWTDEWSYDCGTGKIFAETKSLSLVNHLNSSTTYIAFTATGNLNQFNGWYIDDVKIGSILLTPDGDGILYVTPNGGVAKTGSSWANALNGGDFTNNQSLLDYAINNVPSGTKIYVAGGIYKPTNLSPSIDPNARNRSFTLANGVEVYGGYNPDGSGTRNILTFQSILSGDIGVENTETDNSFSVVNGSNISSTAMLDGFTITKGYASGSSSGTNFGGGLFAENTGIISINNCLFEDNLAYQGGAILARGNLNITKSIFRNNTASNLDYTSGSGSAVKIENAANVSLTNCLLHGNDANGGSDEGGVITLSGGTATLINCTVANNNSISSTGTGGISNIHGNTINLKNTIVANNRAAGASSDLKGVIVSQGFNFIGNTSGSTGIVNAINDDIAGTSGALLNPLLVNDLSDYHLQNTSPVVNKGTSIGAPTTDIEGSARVGNVEIGAYENPTKLIPVITWTNPADIVYGTALNETQLNATANTAGTFDYLPVSGTILNVGNAQDLTANFTPTDAANYTTATKTVQINVLLANPVAISATNIAANSFTANWNVVVSATGYYLDVSTENTFTSGLLLNYNNLNVNNVTSYSVTGLTKETPYYYRVRAYNSSMNSDYSNAITVITDMITWNGTTWVGGVPTASDAIKIAANYSENTNINCNNLTISNPAVLTINPNINVTVNGTLTNNTGNAGIIIKSDATGTGSLIHSTGTVPATVERYALQNRTYYFSSAVSNAKANSFAGTVNLFKYDAAAPTPAWAAVTIDDVNILTSGQGFAVKYIANVPNIKFIGNLNAGAVSPVISHNIQGFNWNLVGNPYPSAIDWEAAGWTRTNIDNAIYVRTGVNTVATYSSGIGLNGGSRYIAIGQAFWIRTTANSPALSFNNSVRLHRAVNMLKGSNTISILRMSVEATSYSDEIAIALNDNASNGIDALDAYKMFSNGDYPELYSVVDNHEMVINQLSTSNTPLQIILGVKSKNIATYTLRANLTDFDNYSGSITLVDNLLSKRIDLRTNPTYTFTSAVGSINNRFMIDFTKNATGISEDKVTNTKIFAVQNQIHIQFTEAMSAQVDVLDLVGRILISKKVSNADNIILGNGLHGVYLVRVKCEKGSITEKIYLQ